MTRPAPEPTTEGTGATGDEPLGTLAVPAAARRETPANLFWLWFAGGLSVLALPTGAGLVGVWKLTLVESVVALAAAMAVAAVVLGVVSIAGHASGLNTLTLSRSAFGHRGNVMAIAVSLVVLVGWGAVSTLLVVYGAEAVLARFGIPQGDVVRIVLLVVFSAALVVLVATGYRFIAATQRWIAFSVGALSLALLVGEVATTNWSAIAATPRAGALPLAAGAVTVLATAGSGWWNAAADYSRFQNPANATRRVFVVTGAGMGGIAIMVILGIVLGYRAPDLATADNPIIALTSHIPSWFVLPYLFMVVVGIHATAVMNSYSAALNLGVLGLRGRLGPILLSTLASAGIAIWVLFFERDFFGPFTAFLTVVGVPLAAWTGVFVIEVLHRRHRGWDVPALEGPGRGLPPVLWPGLVALVVATVVGLGFVSSDTSGFTWVGYLNGGELAQSGVGVPLALAAGAVVYLVLSGRRPWR
jgi:purine-cytosine permease-like protein